MRITTRNKKEHFIMIGEIHQENIIDIAEDLHNQASNT